MNFHSPSRKKKILLLERKPAAAAAAGATDRYKGLEQTDTGAPSVRSRRMRASERASGERELRTQTPAGHASVVQGVGSVQPSGREQSAHLICVTARSAGFKADVSARCSVTYIRQSVPLTGSVHPADCVLVIY